MASEVRVDNVQRNTKARFFDVELVERQVNWDGLVLSFHREAWLFGDRREILRSDRSIVVRSPYWYSTANSRMPIMWLASLPYSMTYTCSRFWHRSCMEQVFRWKWMNQHTALCAVASRGSSVGGRVDRRLRTSRLLDSTYSHVVTRTTLMPQPATTTVTTASAVSDRPLGMYVYMRRAISVLGTCR
jgi:hypothetical protein